MVAPMEVKENRQLYCRTLVTKRLAGGVTVKTEEVIQKRRRFLKRWDVNFPTLAAKIIVDPP
jgi:hypothetical protein